MIDSNSNYCIYSDNYADDLSVSYTAGWFCGCVEYDVCVDSELLESHIGVLTDACDEDVPILIDIGSGWRWGENWVSG